MCLHYQNTHVSGVGKRESVRETVIEKLHEMPLRRRRRKARHEVRVKFVKISFPEEMR